MKNKKIRYTCAPSSNSPSTTNYDRYGPIATKCAIALPTPLINPSISQCYIYCSLYGPNAQELPMFFNYLPNADSSECFCGGSTCLLVPFNPQRRRLIEKVEKEEWIDSGSAAAATAVKLEDDGGRLLTEADSVYGAYQITVLATMSPTLIPTLSPTGQPTQCK